ncbi:MAG: DNA repair protein RadA [Patescibacteria group bacterium]
MKIGTIFTCQKCGSQTPKWMGQCPECGQWGSLVEEVTGRQLKRRDGMARDKAKLLKLDSISAAKIGRIKVGIGELDRVLGGGIVPGSVVLFAGEPGIGKSTLLTQIALKLAKQMKIIYVCGEESPQQVKLRVNRLSPLAKSDSLLLFPETNVDAVVAELEAQDPKDLLLVVDSIQTMSTTDLNGVAGSISQVREASQRLIELAKRTQMPLFLVGHVTKSGTLAGPKTIEHAVDTVLYFEGQRNGDFRILRSVKNRFGPTDEVGVFQMTDKGLNEVTAASFVSDEDLKSSRIGSAYTVVFEGSRPMLIEVQALCSRSFSPIPRRVVNGLDRRRCEMLIAVLQKQLKLPLWEQDIFLNVAGGFKVFEPAVDLAVAAALYSSYKNQALPGSSVFIGETSLLGRINAVGQMSKRISQAKALGLTKIFSSANLPNLWQIKKLIAEIK